MEQNETVSVVVPVFDEAETLARLHAELDAIAKREGYQLQILLVDDGSGDGSWREIQRLAGADHRVEGIRLRRNFGKAAALTAGFEAARGEYVFTVDADLQDDPAEMPQFLDAMRRQELDVVSGWKRVRHDPWHKVYPSRVFNAMVSLLTGVRLHDHNCGFKCYRRDVIKDLRIYGELHRFVPVLADACGWRVGEVVVQHRPRRFGRSKYGFYRFIKGLLDLVTVCFLTGYGQRPQHLLGTFGLLSFSLGSVGILVLTAAWILSRLDSVATNDVHLHERAIFYYSILALLVGTQFLSAGLLAELFTAFARRDRTPYSIRERTGDVRAGSPASTLSGEESGPADSQTPPREA